MSYREHAPPPGLAPWVQCAWQRSGDGAAPVRVVPDGCIDIVWTEGAGTQIVGPNTRAFLVALAAETRVAGVRMRPGAAPALIGVDAVALRDARVPIGDLWGDDGDRLTEALDEGDNRVRVLLDALGRRSPRAPRPDALVDRAVSYLSDPRLEVSRLARELAVSERQLRRRFASAVGYGPKRLSRVLRLQRALHAAGAGTAFGRVAADVGYADHAHFDHDCRDLAGVSPSVLLRG